MCTFFRLAIQHNKINSTILECHKMLRIYMTHSIPNEPAISGTPQDHFDTWYMESTLIKKIFGEIGIAKFCSVSEWGFGAFRSKTLNSKTLKIHISATKNGRDSMFGLFESY